MASGSPSPPPSSGCVLSRLVAAQVAASGVAGRKRGAAQVPGPDVEQQLSEVSGLLEHVSGTRDNTRERGVGGGGVEKDL